MNPRGSQYALGGTLTGWTALAVPTPRQSRLLQSAYRGLNPWVYSRYGIRQWAAPIPWTRMVVKDPFALLSMAMLVELTGALPVLVFRHPGAVLSSYRRMGWTADLAELRRVRPAAVAAASTGAPEPSALRRPSPDAVDMGVFWSVLNAAALQQLDSIRNSVVVAHEEATVHGEDARRRLYEACGLSWRSSDRAPGSPHTSSRTRSSSAPAVKPDLHRFDRSPADVTASWRTKVSAADADYLDSVAGRTLDALMARRLVLG